MANPIFLHVMGTGDIYVSIDTTFTPSGTILGTYKINSSTSNQKIGTLSGDSGAYAVSGATGRAGKEII